MTARCRICSADSAPVFRAKILRKYEIQFSECSRCGFVQTEDPYWLAEAYAEPIVAADIGLIQRNLSFASQAARIIPFFFDADGDFLDYGGGNGMFVRLMRDRGYDFSWQDKYTPNQFAKGFEGLPGKTYELVTAFEVFEHLPDPLAEIDAMLACSKSILFSTLLLPEKLPAPEEWWYYALDGGQHISFYTLRSLNFLAERSGLFLYSHNAFLHLLTPKKISMPLFRIAMTGKYWYIWGRFMKKRKSLQAADLAAINARSAQTAPSPTYPPFGQGK